MLTDFPERLRGLSSNRWGGHSLQLLRGFPGGTYGPASECRRVEVPMSEFEKMRDALVQEFMNVSRFDYSKMSAKARAVVAAASIEFVIVAVAALDEPARSAAVAGLLKGLPIKVAAMADVLRKAG
jgi:hypothetical protein